MNIIFELETFVKDLNKNNNHIRIGKVLSLEKNTQFSIQWDIPKFMIPTKIYSQLNELFSADRYPGLCILIVEKDYFFKMTFSLSLEIMNVDNCLQFMNELFSYVKQYQARYEIISLFY